jgi:hypothetical protein
LSVRIAILVEGATEVAFRRALVDFLSGRLLGKMPKLDFMPADGRIPQKQELRRTVGRLLHSNDAVVALTDVYTGTRDFTDAEDAKQKMRSWVGVEDRFYPHAAQHDFEAWLLPYWSRVQEITGSNRQCPSANPESVNHDKPPAKHLEEIFRTGSKHRRYSKTRDCLAILAGQDLRASADRCGELKQMLNTILKLSGGDQL